MDTINEKLLKGNDIWNGRQYIQHNEDDIIQDLFLGQFVFHELFDRTRWRVSKKLKENCVIWKIWQVLPTPEKTQVFEQRFECWIDDKDNVLNHYLPELLKNKIRRGYFLHLAVRNKWFLTLKKREVIKIGKWIFCEKHRYRIIFLPETMQYAIEIRDAYSKVRMIFSDPNQINEYGKYLKAVAGFLIKGKASINTIKKYKLNHRLSYILKKRCHGRDRKMKT